MKRIFFCRECIRKRERLFLNITKSQITIADYLDFIVYETQMHVTITEKEKLTGIKLSGLKTSIATRIIRMYREMLVKFAHEKRLWNNYIKFSKKSAPQEVAGIYEKMLSVSHMNNLKWLVSFNLLLAVSWWRCGNLDCRRLVALRIQSTEYNTS